MLGVRCSAATQCSSTCSPRREAPGRRPRRRTARSRGSGSPQGRRCPSAAIRRPPGSVEASLVASDPAHGDDGVGAVPRARVRAEQYAVVVRVGDDRRRPPSRVRDVVHCRPADRVVLTACHRERSERRPGHDRRAPASRAPRAATATEPRWPPSARRAGRRRSRRRCRCRRRSAPPRAASPAGAGTRYGARVGRADDGCRCGLERSDGEPVGLERAPGTGSSALRSRSSRVVQPAVQRSRRDSGSRSSPASTSILPSRTATRIASHHSTQESPASGSACVSRATSRAARSAGARGRRGGPAPRARCASGRRCPPNARASRE